MDQGLSAAETARRIGATRSAVIGKAHRLGWAEERDPALAAANQVRAGRLIARALRPLRPPQGGPARSTAVPCTPKPWMQREAGECAFPVRGDGEAVISCCAPSGSQTYCAAHTAQMYAPRPEAQRVALERLADWVRDVEGPKRRIATGAKR